MSENEKRPDDSEQPEPSREDAIPEVAPDKVGYPIPEVAPERPSYPIPEVAPTRPIPEIAPEKTSE